MKLANTLKHVSIMILAAGASYAPVASIQSICAAVLGAYLAVAVLAFMGTALIVPKLGGICNQGRYWFAATTIANRPMTADACLGASAMMLLMTEHFALAASAFALIALTALIRVGVSSYFNHEHGAYEEETAAPSAAASAQAA